MCEYSADDMSIVLLTLSMLDISRKEQKVTFVVHSELFAFLCSCIK